MDPLEFSTESDASTAESNNDGPTKDRWERIATRDFPGMRIGGVGESNNGGAAEKNNGEQRKEREKPFAIRHCPLGMRIRGAIPMVPKKAIAKKRTEKFGTVDPFDCPPLAETSTENSEGDPVAHLLSDCESIDTQASTSRRPAKSFKKEADGVVVRQRSYRQ